MKYYMGVYPPRGQQLGEQPYYVVAIQLIVTNHSKLYRKKISATFLIVREKKCNSPDGKVINETAV